MNNALLFSQIFAPLMIILGISMIINKNWYADIMKKVQKAHVSIFVFSIFGFIFGMYTLAHSAGFSNAYEIFATIVGVSMTLKGAFYLLTPHVMQKLAKSMSFITKHIHYIGGLYLLIGLYMSYISYM